MNEAETPLLLSLKPCHADMVFDGLKKAELRRRIASYIENRSVFIYVSSPRCELRGGFRVGKVWKGSPDFVWQFVSGLAKVSKPDFDAYFRGSETAFALEITSVWEYECPVSVGFLKQEFQHFVIPQSWRYLRRHEYEFLSRLSLHRPIRLAASNVVEAQRQGA